MRTKPCIAPALPVDWRQGAPRIGTPGCAAGTRNSFTLVVLMFPWAFPSGLSCMVRVRLNSAAGAALPRPPTAGSPPPMPPVFALYQACVGIRPGTPPCKNTCAMETRIEVVRMRMVRSYYSSSAVQHFPSTATILTARWRSILPFGTCKIVRLLFHTLRNPWMASLLCFSRCISPCCRKKSSRNVRACQPLRI